MLLRAYVDTVYVNNHSYEEDMVLSPLIDTDTRLLLILSICESFTNTYEYLLTDTYE